MPLKTKRLAVACIFAAVYAVLSLVSLFPILGAYGAFITLGSVMAPLIGILLGPYLGILAVSVGGFIGWSITQNSPFSFLSFVPGAFTAFGSGLLLTGKRLEVTTIYAVLLVLQAVYPTIGPLWLYPYFLWFQLIGLIVLLSPLSSSAIGFIHNHRSLSSLTFAVAVISLISTLIGQITGTLMFEMMYWPTMIRGIESWRTGQWLPLTFVYPVERSLIMLLATMLGTSLIKAIKANGFEIGG